MSQHDASHAPVRSNRTKILVLNPNSSVSMTKGMKTVIETTDLALSTEVFTYTASAAAPASINDRTGIELSAGVVMDNLHALDPKSYDGILVACFSVHPLVAELDLACSRLTPAPSPAITGIFEASILTAYALLGPGEQWGIVTTGTFWESHLSLGVAKFLGDDAIDPSSFSADNVKYSNNRFAGVQSTGLNASDFHHGVDPGVVTEKIKDATKRCLAGGKTTVVVMGCAGMAGLEDTIRAAASEVRGEDWAYSTLHVVDGVRAGLMQLEQMVKYKKLRPGPQK